MLGIDPLRHDVERARAALGPEATFQALRPGGSLLLRVHDASQPLRYAFGLWADRMTMLLHGGGFGRLEGCTPAGWRERLQALGLEVQTLPMNGRAPFRNLLLVARLPALGTARVTAGPEIRPRAG